MPAFPKPTATETDPVASPTAAAALALADTKVPKSLIDAKGDLIVGSADDTPIRKGVGSDGQVLTADAASAGGVKWAAASATPSDASTTVKGITKLSVAPVSAAAPIAVGDNDGRMTDARTPTGTTDSLIDAKGDLIVGTADNTRARKAVGADGRLLRANSGQSDGLEWGLPAVQQPADRGLLAQSFEPSGTYHAAQAVAGGYRYYTRVPIGRSCTLTNVIAQVTNAGSGLTSGQCLAGVYSSAGTLLGKTATQHTAWQSTGTKTMALTAESGQSLAVTPGYVIVAFLAVGSGMPSFASTIAATAITNVGQSGTAQTQFFDGAAAATSLASTLGTPGGANIFNFWAGLS